MASFWNLFGSYFANIRLTERRDLLASHTWAIIVLFNPSAAFALASLSEPVLAFESVCNLRLGLVLICGTTNSSFCTSHCCGIFLVGVSPRSAGSLHLVDYPVSWCPFFFELLVLKCTGVINVDQQEAFGSIMVTKTVRSQSPRLTQV